MRDVFLLLITVAYFVLGFRAPFVFGLGYIWTDYFDPQHVGFSFMTSIPVSLLMAVSAIIAYAFAPKQRTQFVPGIWLLIVWAAWITLTTTWAEVPSDAWSTWNWSFKTLCFAAFLPFLFKTRVQLEAMLLTIVLGIGGSILAFGTKTLLGGGRYGASISLAAGNSGLAEEATLACVAIAVIPIFLYAHEHGVIIKNRRISFALFYGLSAAAIATCIGTFERTGLISLAVFGLLSWWNSKRKLLIAALFSAAFSLSGFFLSDIWLARMDTIQHPEGDVSAMGRLAVWAWDLDYVASHPWGGGFDVYEINHISIPVGGDSPHVEEQSGRAPHSIYFQVLSEHGYPGALIFGAIIVAFFANGRRVYQSTKKDESLRWANSLSRTLMISATVYLSGGTFVGIAFQPFLYDLIAAGVILNQCTRKTETALGTDWGLAPPGPI